MTLDAAAAGSDPLTPELRGYAQQFKDAKAEARAIVAGLTDAQFNSHPAPDQWSIAECLEHLSVTGYIVIPHLDRGIARARERGWMRPGACRYDTPGNRCVRTTEAGELPPPRRTKAPKFYVPSPNPRLVTIVPLFLALQDELVRRVREANGVDLARVKIASPVTRLVRLSLGQWFALLAGHQRRHLWQARRVRSHPDFPAA